MKKKLFMLFFMIIGIFSLNAMQDIENKVDAPKKESLLRQIKRTASQPDSVSDTKKLFKKIQKLDKTKAKKTFLESRKWLIEQLADATHDTQNATWHANANIGESIFILACFASAAIGGIIGHKELLLIGAAIGFVMGIIQIVQLCFAKKYVNQAESKTINNNEIREMLLALEKVQSKIKQ